MWLGLLADLSPIIIASYFWIGISLFVIPPVLLLIKTPACYQKPLPKPSNENGGDIISGFEVVGNDCARK